jgi:cellulose synthase/poly-beta-1,6-N-acetylglucosamine synthase-like glycosyltransferase
MLNGIHVTPGPFSAYRKEFFEKHGYFDENNLTEDIEIALRIQKNHYKIENSINAPVYTVAPNNFMALLKQRMRWYYGFVKNIRKNKDLFNSKYGYLGLLLLPSSIISVSLAIIIFFYFLYKNIGLLIDWIIQIKVTGMDLFALEMKTIKIQYLTDALSNFILNPLLLMIALAFILSMVSIMISKRSDKENKHIFWPFVLFSFTYWFFYAIWWITPLVWRAFGGKFKWGKRYYS